MLGKVSEHSFDSLRHFLVELQPRHMDMVSIWKVVMMANADAAEHWFGSTIEQKRTAPLMCSLFDNC